MAAATTGLLRIWTHREYALFMGGGTPSYVTTWMQRVGIGWLAWQLTHSTLWLGIVSAADLAPMLIISPFAGAIVDRREPLPTLRITQFLLLLQSVGLAVFDLTGTMSIAVLLMLSLWSGIIYPFHQSARASVVVATVPREDLAPAIATDSTLFQLSRFLGPTLAGIVIPVFGVGGTFLAHCVGSLLFTLALRMVRPRPAERTVRLNRNLFLDVAEGFAYVRTHPGIWPLFVMLAMASLFLRPQQDMFPAFASEVFGSDAKGLAWLVSATGIGALVSAAWIATRGTIRGLTYQAIFGYLLFALSTAAFVATELPWTGVLCAGLGGFALNSMSTSTQTITQSSVSDTMRGRVMSFYGMIWRGVPALGAMGAGYCAEHIGIRPTFAVASAICLVSWLTILPRRQAMARAAEKAGG